MSVVEVPLTLSLKDLQENLRDQLPLVLLEESGREIHKGVLADWTVSRQGEVFLQGRDDNQLRLVVPLQIEARAYTERQVSRQERRGVLKKDRDRGRGGSPDADDVSSEAEVEEVRGPTLRARLTLTADLRLDIGADWQLVPAATVDYAWDEPPVLEVGPLRLDITRLIDEKLREKLPDIAARIEERVRARDRIPGRIAELWGHLTTPRPLPRPADAWLVIEPETIAISDPRVEGAALRMTAGLRGRVYTILGTPPQAEPPPLPRRTRRLEEGAGEGLRLQVNAELAWPVLSAQAAAVLNGKSWPLAVSGQEAGTFTVTGAELYPSGDSVAVGLNYTAASTLWTTSGTLWLTGQPTLDVERQTVQIENFDYTVDAWELAAVGANLDTVRDLLLQQLDQDLSFPFGGQIDDKLVQANAQLRRVELARGGELTALLHEVSVQDLLLTDTALVLQAELRGSAQLRLPPPPPE